MFEPKYYEQLEKNQSRDGGIPGEGTFNLGALKRKGAAAKVSAYFFEHSRLPYWLLRKFFPVLRLGQVAIVTRYADVKQILTQPEAFEVPFGREMTELVAGQNAVLGMNDLAEHKVALAHIRCVFSASDLEPRIGVPSAQFAREVLDESGGRIDIIKDLMALVPTKVCRDYYGLDIDDEDAFAEWTIAVSTMLFGDPFGDLATRELGLTAGALLRQTIIRSIAKAHTAAASDGSTTASSPDTIVARLVRLQRSGNSALTDDVIRSIVFGMVIGFVPTCTLGASNIWQVLLECPTAMAYCGDAARRGDDRALRLGLLEAMRLRPPLNPGVFRYVRERFELGSGQWYARKLPVGTTVFVATASAMNDERVIDEPGAFRPDRDTNGSLLFGHGLHWCVGQPIAEMQMTQMFKVLLREANLRPANGAAGKLAKLGPFPLSQMIEYGPLSSAPAGHDEPALITICLPVQAGVDREALKQKIAALGNPARPDIARCLLDTGLVHYASMSLIEGAADEPDLLVLEMSADGSEAEVFAAVAGSSGDILAPIFAAAAPSTQAISDDLSVYLQRHACPIGPWLHQRIGLTFCGIPGLSLKRVRQEQGLEEVTRRMVADFLQRPFGNARQPLHILRSVRQQLSERGYGWALSPQPMPFTDTAAAPWTTEKRSIWTVVFELVRAAPLVSFVLVAATGLLTTWIFNLFRDGVGEQSFGLLVMLGLALKWGLAAAAAVIMVILGIAAVLAILAFYLRRQENSDLAIDYDPELAKIAKIMANENAAPNGVPVIQNHMTAVSRIKPGFLRAVTLRLAFYVVGLVSKTLFRPGFISDVGTIHFARWVQLPGTRNLLFASNYDGSWESYLEDFITKAFQGLNAIWSNTTDYPRTKLLFFKGATDGDRFKRWARRQQIPTLFWFNAEPGLTTDRKRTNAMIRDGIARARTLSDAQAWLDLLGSIPRPAGALEFDEIQSLAFGGMGSLPHAACLLVNFPDVVERSACKTWLNGLVALPDRLATNAQPDLGSLAQAVDTGARQPLSLETDQRQISFGDRVPHNVARIIALSAPGLSRLGVAEPNRQRDPDDTLTAFPSAFVYGMADATRSRILGDIGDSDPRFWQWGTRTTAPGTGALTVHAALLLYAKDADKLNFTIDVEQQALTEAKLRPVTIIRMQPLSKDPTKRKEPFGFLDGISQPLIRGTRAFHRNPSEILAVEPGELILGYPDNRGFFPPSPQVLAKDDPRCCLPSPPAGLPARYPQYAAMDRPRFAVRDLGLNGSYLVMRQLEQDVAGFHAYLESEATRLVQEFGLQITPDWVGGKLMGRWSDGSSLVHQPEPPPKAQLGKDDEDAEDNVANGRQRLQNLQTGNDFLFGVEDPQGLRCPYGSHVRRANPRESLEPGNLDQLAISNRHRILRVGRPYVADDERSKPRGLLFMCLNADIDRQFEFIQQNWISGQSFHGLRNEVDAIAATGPGGRCCTIPQPRGPIQLASFKPFVKVVGGDYFFLPSRRALHYLSST